MATSHQNIVDSGSNGQPPVEQLSTITNSSNLPTSTNRRRGRPPTYASNHQRREATNAGRREIRRTQQINNASTSAQNTISATTSMQHTDDTDEPTTRRRRLDHTGSSGTYPDLTEPKVENYPTGAIDYTYENIGAHRWSDLPRIPVIDFRMRIPAVPNA